jgi:hypothetical protein
MQKSAMIYAGIVAVIFIYSLSRGAIFKAINQMQVEQKLPGE